MALRWFVGLNLDQDAWDASTFSQNRRRRFDASGVLEKLFDETVKRAMKEGLISRHVSADGTLVRANASFKSFVPIEVAMDPEEYKKRLRAQDRRRRRRSAGSGQPRRGLPRREAQQQDASIDDGPRLSLRLEGIVGNRRLSRLHGQRADGEPQPHSAGDRRGDLPLVGVGDGGLHLAARSSEAPASLRARDTRSRQGLLQRAVHRGDCSTVASSRTSPLRPAGASSPMRGCACESAAPAISSRSAAARRSRSCSAKPRTGTACDDSEGGVCYGFARRRS